MCGKNTSLFAATVPFFLMPKHPYYLTVTLTQRGWNCRRLMAVVFQPTFLEAI
jgi:hypothetical protein